MKLTEEQKDLIRFYINNGTDKTIEMLKDKQQYVWVLKGILKPNNKGITTDWVQVIARDLLQKLEA